MYQTRSTTNSNGIATRRSSRRALGDVSNVNSRNGNGSKNGGTTSKQGFQKKPKRAATSSSTTTRSQSSTSVVDSNNNNPAVDNMEITNSNNTINISNDIVVQQQQAAAAVEARGDPNSYQYTGQVDNIDERDAEDPLCATEYVQDMYTHFRSEEVTKSVRPVYMDDQPYINERMRSILVDWLVEVHLKFKLVPETLYLTVNLIDRYLERSEVSRNKLQLVGVTALLLASKYEEIYPPELRDLVYICDRAYTSNEIISMEETILKTLEYQVTIPSAHCFLVRYLKAAHADKKIVQLSCYILDGTLQSYSLLHYLPSQLAAAAVLLARRCVGRNSWSPTLLKYAEYCEEDILPVARAVLAEKSAASPELRAVNKKYTSTRYGQVANTVLVCDF